jgi:hypothetical protein
MHLLIGYAGGTIVEGVVLAMGRIHRSVSRASSTQMVISLCGDSFAVYCNWRAAIVAASL